MKNNKLIKIFNTIVLIITIVTFCLAVFYNTAFVPSFMLMLSLFLFGICYYYYIRDCKKGFMYTLFVIGIFLIIGSLVYTFMRII